MAGGEGAQASSRRAASTTDDVLLGLGDASPGPSDRQPRHETRRARPPEEAQTSEEYLGLGHA
eukprot:4008968-Pyramimonas_sp.AAC.1